MDYNDTFRIQSQTTTEFANIIESYSLPFNHDRYYAFFINSCYAIYAHLKRQNEVEDLLRD